MTRKDLRELIQVNLNKYNENDMSYIDIVFTLEELAVAFSDYNVNSKKSQDVLSIEPRKSRCCGRCDGVSDLCVADQICNKHDVMGCEICYGER